MKTRYLHRRRFLQLTVGITTYLALRPADPWSATDTQSALSILEWNALFDQPQSACVIGQAYLQTYEDEADVYRLLEQLALDVVGRPAILGPVAHTELKELLRQRISQDFAQDEVVKLNGWILSRTEARVCALVAITAVPQVAV